MAWDWTNGADDFQEFVWVLVIPLRDIERNQTVGDIAKTYLSDSNSVQPHQIDEYILANPTKVFIIFDGLDEHDDDVVKQENDIAKIIRSEKFKECREYLAGMYLASRFESEHEQYEKAMNDVIKRAAEFRYLLYFTASQTKKVAIDISNRLINRNYNMNTNFLVDVTFEAYDEDAETLTLSRRSWGPTVSRDLADVICSSTSLTALELSGTALHDNFYDTLENKVKTSKNNATSESTIKVERTTAERTINCNDTTTHSTTKDRNSATEATIKEYNRSSEPTIKDTNLPIEPTIKYHNTRIEPSIKDNTSTIHCNFKEKNTSTECPIKGNNSTSESTIECSSTTNEPAIKENHTPSRTPTEENINQPVKVNIAQAEYPLLPDGKHSFSSQIPSSLKGTTDGPVMQESTCLPEMLLIKAGDVERNPGPFDRSASIQEQELVNLAYDVPSSKYTELCIALDVSYNKSQTILDRHHWDFTRSLIAVFCEWKNRQRDGTDCRQVMAAALRGVHLDAFGDKMSGGGYLPQKVAPTESAVGEETQPLTKEQVNQCAQDFKTFYRTRLCKIKTDPLDFNSILEFERIYTNLVLLRNEMGTTRETPLDYTELLTTKVNGEFPKRLMVEGEGGAGKTTFCSKIAWDWTERTKEFEEFDWVLVIPFRNTNEGQTVGDIAKTYLSDSNTVQSRQIDRYILSAPLKVFIIFDGLDEYDGDILKESSDFAKIIRSEKFVECRVLVTTRPWRAVPSQWFFILGNYDLV
eukprot:XP_011663054.1 PREDICTED: uncharacterized protein LOC105437763 [Strongylocentrotus purpuratus]